MFERMQKFIRARPPQPLAEFAPRSSVQRRQRRSTPSPPAFHLRSSYALPLEWPPLNASDSRVSDSVSSRKSVR